MIGVRMFFCKYAQAESIHVRAQLEVCSGGLIQGCTKSIPKKDEGEIR